MPKLSDKSNESALVKVEPKVLDLDQISSASQPVSQKQLEDYSRNVRQEASGV